MYLLSLHQNYMYTKYCVIFRGPLKTLSQVTGYSRRNSQKYVKESKEHGRNYICKLQKVLNL